MANPEIITKIKDKLLALRDYQPGTSAGLSVDEINLLCSTVKQIYLDQPILLELRPPLTVCGDVHGQFHDLLRLFDQGSYPPESNYLFMGDYVDRGRQSIETVCLLFCYKIMYPNNFFMLRGNHECSYINRLYGFYEDCLQHYNFKVWRTFGEVFNCLPIAAIIDDKIFCIHGGISPRLNSLDDIRSLQRPIEVPEEGLLCDLLWSDPSNEVDTWEENDRGTSVCFGVDPVKNFLQQFGFDLICRAHQAVMNGYEFPFFPDQSLVTIFSAPNYCYEFENKGAILKVDENLFCTFSHIEPMKYEEEMFVNPSRPGTPPRSGNQDEEEPNFISLEC